MLFCFGGRLKADQRKGEKALKLYDSESHTVAEITEMTGVTKATLYRALKAKKNKVVLLKQQDIP